MNKLVGSFDVGDSTTTNLYIGNVNPTVNENDLCDIFAAFGPLASVKIMWPRTDEERARNRNSGFVAYMNRHEAEMALRSLNGISIKGYDIKLGWAKPVPIPPMPIAFPDQLKIQIAQSHIAQMMMIKPPERQLRDQFRGFNSDSSNAIDAGQPTRIKGTLEDTDREKLYSILIKLDTRKKSIGEAMLFCINHSDAAKEVIEEIYKSIVADPDFDLKPSDDVNNSDTNGQKDDDKEASKKNGDAIANKFKLELAKLYLISDILHNCSAQVTNASYYRNGFKTKLEDIFSHVGGKLTKIQLLTIDKADSFKSRILTIFKAWKDWTLYEDEFLVRLSGLALGLGRDEICTSPERKNNDFSLLRSLDGEIISDQLLNECLESKNLTSEWYKSLGLHEDINSNVLDQTTATDPSNQLPVAKITSEQTLAGIDEVDHSVSKQMTGSFKASKWETVDPDEVAEQVVTLSKWSKSFISIEHEESGCQDDNVEPDVIDQSTESRPSGDNADDMLKSTTKLSKTKDRDSAEDTGKQILESDHCQFDEKPPKKLRTDVID